MKSTAAETILPNWSLATRITFRFVYAYFVLYDRSYDNLLEQGQRLGDKLD